MEQKKSHSIAGKSFIAGFWGYIGACSAIFVIFIVTILFFSSINNAKNKAREASLNDALQTDTTNQSTNNSETPFKTYQLGESFNITESNIFDEYSWEITNSELNKLDYVVNYNKEKYNQQYGKFYLFIIEALNKGKEQKDIEYSITNDLILVTSDGTRYSQLDNFDVEYAIQNKSYGIFTDYYSQKKANPGNKAKSYIVFDVPEQDYKLCQKDLNTFCINAPK